MTGLPLLLLALLGPPPSDDPAQLVRQLGSRRFADREAASRALRAIGEEALPALKGAGEVRDPEVRSRAEALLDVIETERLVRPTLVRLDFRDRPLEEVVATLGRRGGVPITLDPSVSRGEVVSLVEPAPVTLWQAIGRLSAGGRRLQVNLGPQLSPEGGGAKVGIHLYPVARVVPVSDHGPFRVKVVSGHYERNRFFDPGPGEALDAGTNQQFFLQMQVLAEPRLWVRQAGPLKDLVAVDDRGQSLSPSSPSSSPADEVFESYDGFNQGAILPLTVALNYPARPGQSIKALRGTVPVSVSARKPEPLVVPLSDAAGKTFRAGDFALEIHSIKADPNLPRTAIDLTLRRGNPAANPGSASRPTVNASLIPSVLENQIEVVDAEGHVLPSFLETAGVEDHQARLTLALDTDGAPQAGLRIPSLRLRFYSLIEARTEVVFSLGDIPMP